MDFIHRLARLAESGLLDWIFTLALGLLFLFFLFAPVLEGRHVPWRKQPGVSELASTGALIRAVSGFLIIILLVVWVVFGR